MHSTNYQDTFIAVAPDCPATQGTIPKEAATPSAARIAYRLIQAQPYGLTSDDVLFAVFAERQRLPPTDREAARAKFFARPQACLRASDLGKRYGWGIHSDASGKVALVGVETDAYRMLLGGRVPGHPEQKVTVKYAMRSRRTKST
ncbi:MAG: hypothetical protein JNJ46_19710 [Myxococcales bacterium]|nr:hypothetical protein [Myxococcales bacterium]